jgi:L-alanine-DL-glutamate epimerase-like enolase superfamily enzyme
MSREGGFAIAPTKPGLGIDWDEDALAARMAAGSHFEVKPS